MNAEEQRQAERREGDCLDRFEGDNPGQQRRTAVRHARAMPMCLALRNLPDLSASRGCTVLLCLLHRSGVIADRQAVGLTSVSPWVEPCSCGLHASVSIARNSTRTIPVRVARPKATRFFRTGSTSRSGAGGVVPAGEGSDGDSQGIGKSIPDAGFAVQKPDPAQTGPATRASDHVPNLDFDGAKEHKPAARTRLNQAHLEEPRALRC